MPLHIVHHPDYDAGLPANHRFPMGKYPALIRRLDALGFGRNGHSHNPTPAPSSWLKLIHAAAYVDQVIACAVPERIEREIGFPVNERVSRRAQLASGGTVMAARLALAHGVACNAAGGSHHARREQGAGFCTFNDVAVAAAVLLADGEARNILVVDLDVHQGDGTASIFSEDPAVFTLSIHGERNYPVRKAKSDLDIGLPDGTGDAVYLAALSEALTDTVARMSPDIVFYNAGVDPHAEDRLGRMAMSDTGLRARDEMVLGFYRSRRVPVCGVIGGGYSHDIEALAARHAILFESAAKFA